MVYDRAARGEDGGVVHRVHNLDVVKHRDAGAVVGI
jgi:hypothetical protein